jgi:CBS domain-containing protein
MQAKDVMSPQVEVVRPDSSIAKAAESMKMLDVGAPVCDGERLVGIITDRDITIEATAQSRDPNGNRVREIMSPGMVQEKQIRRLPVLSSRGKVLVGIVALSDLATKTESC